MNRFFLTLILIALTTGQMSMIVSTGNEPRAAYEVPCWSISISSAVDEIVVEDEDANADADAYLF